LKGRAVAFFAAAIPLAFVLGFVFWFHSALSPGIVALGLFPPSEPGDLRGGVFAFPVNGVSWLVLFSAGYALICKARRSLRRLESLCAWFLLWRLAACFLYTTRSFLSQPCSGSSADLFLRDHPDGFYFWLSLFADAICWFIVLWFAYKLAHEWTARGSARAANKEAKHS
jgi:hypothetical protein